MLGAVESSQQWCWAAYGKHAVAKDYFSLGENVPLLQALWDWVEKGYHTLASKRVQLSDLYSYRFWARGAGKGTFVCGLVKTSTDGVGRPYPLLLAGTGPLTGWEDQWDLLPFACESSWNQMERISTKSFEDLKHFNDEIHNIKPPAPHWSDYFAEREDLGKVESSPIDESYGQKMHELNDLAARIAKRNEIFISLDKGPSLDQFTLVILWHYSIKAQVKVLPNTVFMGGIAEKACLAIFQRPLTPADFVQLWSLSSLGILEDGFMVTR